MSNRGLGVYGGMIRDATGESDLDRVNRIERCMRREVFASTLDWLTPEQFRKGAKEAVKILAKADQPAPRKRRAAAATTAAPKRRKK
jgi:hypothetical protein